MEAEKQYNPFDHRNLELPNTFRGALIHLLKGSLGTGMLAVPGAIAAAGIIPGMIGTLFLGIICAHSLYLLVQTSQEICKTAEQPFLGFSQTAEAVFKHGPDKLKPFANSAKIFVDLALAFTYYGCLAVYVVFMSSNIKQMAEFYHPEVEDWPPQYFMVSLLIPLIGFGQIRELKYLVPFSLMANSAMITVFVITLYYMFDGLGSVDISDRKLSNGVSLMGRFFSTIVFSMEGIGIALPIANSMSKPQFLGKCGVLNIGMVFVTTMYMIIGFFGYYKYGDWVGANIIANFNSEDKLAKAARILIIIAVFFTFILQFHVPCDITWRMVPSNLRDKYYNLAQVIVRTSIIIFVIIIAAAVPKLDAIIDLVGAVFFSTLGLMVTATMDTVRLSSDECGDSFGYLKWRLWKNILMLVLWLYGLISGVWMAVGELIN